MTYFKLLDYVFKYYSVTRAWRTAVPTAWHYLRRSALPASQKPALFSMTILPTAMKVWYHFAKKHLGDSVDITIFDSSGELQQSDVPGARLQPFLNWYAATKSDEFLKHISRNRRIGWLCDDDVLFIGNATQIVEEEMAIPNTAAVSFSSRKWWQFDINGKHIEPLGSYCTAINRNIFIEKENLSCVPQNGNEHPSLIGKPVCRYDTLDKANEVLLQKGYRCAVVDETKSDECIAMFRGMSSGVMLLNYFKTPQALLAYLQEPNNDAWLGNILFRALSALLTIDVLLELEEDIYGKRTALQSMPSRTELWALRDEKEPLLREKHTFNDIEHTAEKLRRAL